jgi:hypothetical protein
MLCFGTLGRPQSWTDAYAIKSCVQISMGLDNVGWG